ncbi:MAG: orotate phosphoribosyltransferase [Spirochaetes bacterium]|nr:orotate phosphoribosyltransferase [Spirochaetota bacterium]
MKDYQKKFIEFLISTNALKFGEFTLKSGRRSPYFLNMGAFYEGSAISELGKFYAHAISDAIKDDFTVIFGPAYKGIPLAIAAVHSLFVDFGINVSYAFNRKEAKDHGEAGVLVGKTLEPTDRIVIVDDVITAGTAVRETLDIIAKHGNARVRAIVVSVDRMEKGTGNKSAIEEIFDIYGIPVIPIVTIFDILEFLKNHVSAGVDASVILRIKSYLKEYGAIP